MATVETVRVGDEGTVFTVSLTDAGVTFDPSAATLRQLGFKDPTGDQTMVTATLSGTDLQWTSTTGFFAEIGTWYFWGYVETAQGKWSSEPQKLTVKGKGEP